MRSMIRLSICALVLGLAFAVPTSARQAKKADARPKVALLDFDYGTIEHWWSGNEDIGKGISAMVEDMLSEDGSFRIFDRSRLNAVLAEQNFNASDRVDPTA